MKRERVISALRHKQTDAVPYNVELCADELEKVISYAGIGKEQYWDWSGNHIEKISYNGGSCIGEDVFRDEYGVVWDRRENKDIGIPRTILAEPDLNGYAFPKPDLEAVKKKTAAALSNGRDSFKMGKIGLAYFERAWSIRGFENLLTDFYLEEDFAAGLFDCILQNNLEIINTALDYDIDGFYFGDDYGQQNSLLMSPECWRKYIKPGLKLMFEPVKRAGKFVALHSCGNISEILPDLIEIGLDVYQTVQPEIYDLKHIKNKYGADLSFWGGISTQRDLPFAAPDKIKTIVNETIHVLNNNGGYIAGPTHQVPSDAPVENVIALIECLKQQ
jgi:uroporphyrinogen decarboxylase